MRWGGGDEGAAWWWVVRLGGPIGRRKPGRHDGMMGARWRIARGSCRPFEEEGLMGAARACFPACGGGRDGCLCAKGSGMRGVRSGQAGSGRLDRGPRLQPVAARQLFQLPRRSWSCTVLLGPDAAQRAHPSAVVSCGGAASRPVLVCELVSSWPGACNTRLVDGIAGRPALRRVPLSGHTMVQRSVFGQKRSVASYWKFLRGVAPRSRRTARRAQSQRSRRAGSWARSSSCHRR